jgi:hypothetical protein
MTRNVVKDRLSKASKWIAPALVGLASIAGGAIAACDLTPPPRAMREPDSVDEDDPTALMPEPHAAEGALKEVGVSVKGKAPDRYLQALERALLRAGMKVVEQGQTADLVLDLSIDADAEAVPIETEESGDEEVDKEFEHIRGKLVVTRGDQPVASVESAARFELRTVTASGRVLATKRTLDQVDMEFCGAGMNGLVTKLVHSAAVNEAAKAALASKPEGAPEAGAGTGADAGATDGGDASAGG